MYHKIHLPSFIITKPAPIKCSSAPKQMFKLIPNKQFLFAITSLLHPRDDPPGKLIDFLLIPLSRAFLAINFAILIVHPAVDINFLALHTGQFLVQGLDCSTIRDAPVAEHMSGLIQMSQQEAETMAQFKALLIQRTLKIMPSYLAFDLCLVICNNGTFLLRSIDIKCTTSPMGLFNSFSYSFCHSLSSNRLINRSR